jgi:hypothetical protein
MVRTAGGVTTGGVVSRTVTVNDADPVLLCGSVALQATIVVPNAKIAPLAGVQVVATAPSTLSVAEAVKLYAAPLLLVASTVAFAGTVTTGAVVSWTVTVKDAEAAFPCASVAEHCTMVVPNGKVSPLAGVQLVATAPSTLSVAEAEKL